MSDASLTISTGPAVSAPASSAPATPAAPAKANSGQPAGTTTPENRPEPGQGSTKGPETGKAAPDPKTGQESKPGALGEKPDAAADGLPPVAEGKERYFFTVDGKNLYADYTREEAKAIMQKGIGAEKRMQEAVMTKRQAEGFIRQLQKNPFAILERPEFFGPNARKMAEEYILGHLKTEQMTPEQRELAEFKEKARIAEAEKAEQQKALEEKEMQESVARHSADYQRDIVKALEPSGLPRSPVVVKRVAYYMAQAYEQGFKDVSAADVIDLVKEDFMGEVQQLLGGLEGDVLLSVLGDGVAGKIRESDLKRLNPGNAGNQPAPRAPAPRAPTGEKKWISEADFDAEIKRRANS